VALALVTGIREAPGAPALAAALAAGPAPGGALLLELGVENGERRHTVLASEGARAIEEALSGSLPELRFAARGHACHACLPAEPEALDLAAAALAEIPSETPGVVHIPEPLWQEGLAHPGLRPNGALLRVELPRDRALAALAVRDLRCHRARVKLAKRPLSWVASRRAMAGLPLGGQAERGLQRLRAALLGGASRAQALPSLLAAVSILLVIALALVAVAGALTGKARVQRAADLAALSAARSMRDTLPRLLAPRQLPNGSPNPDHLTKGAYLTLARAAAVAAARANGVEARRLELSFPDGDSFAPLRARVRVIAGLAGDRAPNPTAVTAVAVAEAAPPNRGGGDLFNVATGGGYEGPLVFRQGEGMRPDVAAAYDRMSAAAASAGHLLLVTSGYRSDAEQAELFARHPDPRWVAPPGHSLHRCATELDLGPPSAYAWLAAHANRFGFVRRYSWEPWHFGFDAGPPPCSAAAGATGWGLGREPGPVGVPAFVPPGYRAAIVRAAVRWNVSAALLAAQLMAESGFDPDAVSAAGAEGIAQFMPSTAAAYGLRDPFDPEAAIDAQAHLMSNLLRRLGSIELALAAYNAGAGPVQACDCVPPYPETEAYVARILALLDGAGVAPFAESLEVRLVA
jgi:Transglycosylase SLT domain/D-alanyl-D-alanine carboxypeptidase/Putative Flp pilus-assembly TadE/G-like